MLWALLTIAAVLALAEIAIRLFADHDSRFNVTTGRFREWDPHRSFRLKRNFRAGDIQTNSKGILGPEFESRQPTGVFRIVTLGDSYTFVPPGRNYPTVLAEELRRGFPETTIEVVNASTPGYTCIQARLWYEQEIDKYDHDMLVILLGWNDMGQYGPEGLAYKRQSAGYHQRMSWLQRLMARSYLARTYYVWQGYRERRQRVSLDPPTDEERALYDSYRPEHFETNVKRIIGLARSRGRIVVLVNYGCLVHPDPSEDEMRRMHFPRGMGRKLSKYLMLIEAYRAALRRISEETGTPILDVESIFQTQDSRSVFTDSMHFDERGSELIGARLSQQISPYVERALNDLGVGAASGPGKELS